MNSWELLRRLVVARRDDPLWEVLFRRCQVLIRASLRSQFGGRRRVDTALLDDLSQDVMERLVSDGRRVLSRFEGKREEAFAGYIRRIAENLLRDQFRREAFRLKVETSFAPEELWRLEAALADSTFQYAGDDPEAAVESREFAESVERMLRQISVDDRQRALNRHLYYLYFESQYSIPQIARLREVPLSVSSVARRIALMRRELATSLAPHWQRAAIRPAGWSTRKKRTAKKST